MSGQKTRHQKLNSYWVMDIMFAIFIKTELNLTYYKTDINAGVPQ